VSGREHSGLFWLILLFFLGALLIGVIVGLTAVVVAWLAGAL
jgi:hypothetical protein